MAFLLSLLPLLFLLGSGSVQGVTLREHRLRGSEPDLREKAAPYFPPNADMLKALEYIESLRQRTRAGVSDPREQAPLTPDYGATDADTDTEKLRSMLRLASPAQTSPSKSVQDQEDDQENEGDEANEEEKTQEWLKAVLSTLQQTEDGPEPAPVRPSAARHTLGKGRRPAKEDSQAGERVAYQQAQQQRGSRPYRKYKMMFEDDDDREEGGEGRAQGRDSPFKRTNENMEGKYTPQNLANLQSVFEELGRIANTKAGAGHKRQTQDDADDDEDDDMLAVRNLAYEDVTGGEDWSPIEEQVETEDEESDDRQEFDRGLEDDDDGEEEEIDEIKRPSQLVPGEDESDDITKLVDYYLLKVLEKKEQEEQKREIEEEEEREERKAAQTQQSDKVDPQAIYQLIQISQNLQISPEELLDMLRKGEMAKQDRKPLRTLTQSLTSNDLARLEDSFSKFSSHKKTQIPSATFHNRRLPATETNNEDINTEDILKILGLGSVGNQNAPALKKQKQHISPTSRFFAPVGRQEENIYSEKIKDDYDDTLNEDELATYLASQMAQYPEAGNNAEQKRAPPLSSRNDQHLLGTFEQAIQDYFDQMDLNKSQLRKRHSEPEEAGVALQTQGLDDDTMLKILGYLNPETEENEDKDLYAKTVKGM